MVDRSGSRRWWAATSAAGAVLVAAAVAVLAVGFAGAERTTDPESTPVVETPGCSSGGSTWSAVVEVDEGGATGSVVSMTGPGSSDAWTLMQADDARVDEELPLDTDQLPRSVRWSDRPRLITPDGACTIYLLPPPRGSEHPVLVVGDSLAGGLTAGPDRESATFRQASERGVFLSVDGYSGTTWGQAGDPGHRPDERLRGATATDPSIPVVVVLGANDASQAVVAGRLASGLGPDPESARETTREAITAWVPRLVAGGRCVVLVTAPEEPITLYGLGLAYAFEASLVNAEIERTALAGGALVAPFAELSRDHHGSGDATGTWFSDDGLHPNEVGTQALTDLVLDTLDRCPAG